MKTHNESSDQEIEHFFSEWKKRDGDLEIPAFPKVKSRSRLKYLPLGIAACLAIGFWLWNQQPQDSNLENDLVIITLTEGENATQKLTIETKSTIDVWESPTSSLLTAY